MLSIVMSVYNGEKTVGRAIESILNQTYKDFEFIIINDCSRDQTLNILQEYQLEDSRIKILHNEKNLGLAASLNKGINESSGDWIVRMDDDDISLHDRLENQFNFIQMNPDVDIFGGKAIFQDIYGDEVENFFPHWPPMDIKDIENFFYTSSPLIHPTVCMRKQAIKEIGLYNKDFSGAEDYELWVRAWKNGLHIKNMNTILIRYTVNLGKKSFKRIWKKIYVKYYIIKKYNFPRKYHFHNFVTLLKDVLIKMKLFNPEWSIRNIKSNN